jgi:hypothetical protein
MRSGVPEVHSEPKLCKLVFSKVEILTVWLEDISMLNVGSSLSGTADPQGEGVDVVGAGAEVGAEKGTEARERMSCFLCFLPSK